MTTLTAMKNAARYRKMWVKLNTRAAELLAEIAEVEKRSPQEQAAYMLEQQLQRRADLEQQLQCLADADADEQCLIMLTETDIGESENA